MEKPTFEGGYVDDEISLRDIWNLLRRNQWLIFLCVLLVTGGAAAYSYFAVPVYESATTIRIEEERANLPVLDILQELSSGSQVETEMEVLRSRTLAEDVVDSLNLQVEIIEPRGVSRAVLLDRLVAERWAPEGEFLIEPGGDAFRITDEETLESLGEVSERLPAALAGVTFTLTEAARDYPRIRVRVLPFDKAVTKLQKALSVSRPNRDAGIVTVRYESSDTLLVHEVPNRLAASFISRRQRIQKTEASSTVRFLEDQIDTLARQLAAAEERLVAFREEGQVVSIEAEANAQVTELARLQADRNAIDAERSALQELMDEIDREATTADPAGPSPYRRLLSFPTLLKNQSTSELLRSLTEVENQRSVLLQRRTMADDDVQQFTQRIRELEAQLRTVATTYLQGLTNQVQSYDQTLEQFAAQLEVIPQKQVQLARLEREEKVLSELFTLLQTRLKEAQIAQAVEDASIRVVDPAILPSEPIKPKTVLNIALGLILGMMLGVGLAFTREHMDDTVHTREDLVEATGGAPIMGMIPRIRQRGLRPSKTSAAANGASHLGERLVAGRDPRNPVSEAYRSLRTNITFSNPDRPPKTIVFTSPLPQDGKSTSAANLAITLAQQGTRVLLVDADLRRGVLNNVFDLPREPGLSDVITGQAKLSEALRVVDLGESGRMHFLPTGTLPPNPAELLGSERMKTLLRHLEEQFDAIILDSAPLTVVTDAAVLGTNAEGVLLVARANVTERGAIRYSVDQLKHVRAPILGVVLNDIDFRRDSRYSSSYGRYGYYYQYYYGDNGKKKK
ncbi:MAG: polysaccharide biosynthesis tyrosine autokinase, partial [Gemmatimonadetes bacterium]